ncbi:hypothetical protein C8R42DRAFT_9836 [Lentinula raphanica]|nr:hypothetical protein C8R42DRAFT_9836 [Lentinula raphanica]
MTVVCSWLFCLGLQQSCVRAIFYHNSEIHALRFLTLLTVTTATTRTSLYDNIRGGEHDVCHASTEPLIYKGL